MYCRVTTGGTAYYLDDEECMTDFVSYLLSSQIDVTIEFLNFEEYEKCTTQS